jgi:pyruvate,orthophosphate dikinase
MPIPRIDAERALKFGAMGIGLCRTERMFNAVERLPIVVEMIVAETIGDRQVALNKLLPIQRADFVGIFRAMAPRPVTIRLLDPPIHEFLPTADQLVEELDQLKHLRDTLRGMQVLSDAVDFMYRTRDTHPRVAAAGGSGSGGRGHHQKKRPCSRRYAPCSRSIPCLATEACA